MQTPARIVARLTLFTSDLKLNQGALQRQIDYVVKDCDATMVVAASVETQEPTSALSSAKRLCVTLSPYNLVLGNDGTPELLFFLNEMGEFSVE